ncbi:mitochondrial escape protein 2 [Elasticomyces elasticus]|uniref:Mitochondrial escape protein 2 n=1 Tax=Exophiala sideris TaxID=1016849 RepID=A0ABR0JMI6_9EURO|nr:mitochondrial escape protein 2 [Elasticomyces elasticus]KAK5037687.1 mitochondrial escape protein 2 [Exophiala sideris]KAK5043669.1 mitochondrial escape protein 2 [Exophiala sideris]KAK5067168.1 mitochondrial escape protein 2 [Exophiala sideris]KAK5182501.1 mitochondrial escape protein 2 [Eurotiomycetes sp. CCFEE 6388]
MLGVVSADTRTDVFPLRLQWLNLIPFLNPDKVLAESLKKVNHPDLALADPSSIIKRAIPEKLPLTVTKILPRLREGGAFVKFTHEQGISATELESTLKEYLEEKPIKPWFNPFRRVRAFLVQGKPWIEDLYRVPSSRVKVEFLPTSPESSAAELAQETLYSLFRRYGKLAEIITQPFDSKVLPRYAYVDYRNIRFATMAKNVMHGYVVPPEEGGGKAGTLLKLSYEPKVKANWIWSWITNHPRIVLPLLVALVTAASVAVFDPIRTFFIKMHITHGLQLEDSWLYKWAKRWLSRGYDYLRLRKQDAAAESLRIIWEDRQGAITQLQTWLIETADTFIVVQGPRGAGKKELVLDQALKDRPNKLVIDCKRIQEARGDSGTIAAAAAEVGYKPVFSWMNNMSSMIDLAAMGTIGTKTGFSETLDSQLAKIWNNTTTALKEIALSHRKKDEKDAQIADDEWLEAHPEYRPVVVIDNFLHKNNEGTTSLVYDKLGEWAAALTTQNIAHVVFLTTDVSFSKSLSKALPDRVFRQITLSDCTPDVAKKLVLQHLKSEPNEPAEGQEKVSPVQMQNNIDELDSVIQVLGGRLTDLEFLARRIKTGESPTKAVHQIIEQSASEILKMYLLEVDPANRKWTPQQAWLLIKQLAANEVLRYNEVLLDPLFSNGEQVLQTLEQAELITITSSNGRPNGIKPGKPVYSAAFALLTEDEVLKARMDLAIMSQLISIENKNVEKYENELSTLAELPGTPSELKPRIQWCMEKVMASQVKIQKFEAQSAKLKKVLSEQF